MKALIVTGLLGFLLWRVALFGVAASASHFFVYHPDFPYAEALLETSHLPQWIYSWGGFDGVHYISIMTEGYLTIRLIQAFFPLYPMIAGWVTSFIDAPVVAGLLVSNLSAAALAVVWLVFVRTRATTVISNKSLVLLLVFPTAFFLGALYTESLFLLSVILSFWFAEKKQWILAGICGAVASATRLAGIFIWPALIVEVLVLYKPLHSKLSLQNLWQAVRANIAPLLFVSTAVLGFAAYSLYLQMHFQDPLYFFSVQKDFNTGRSDSLVFPLQTLWRQFKIIATVPLDWKWYSYVQDLALTLIAGAGLVVAFFRYKKEIKLSWLVFSVLAFLLPMFTGSLSSMSRYVLVCFPLYIVAAHLLNTPKKWWLVIGISTALLILNTMLFIQGHWVA